MKRLELEIEGVTVGDLYRMVRHLAEDIRLGAVEAEGEYQTGLDDDRMVPYFYRITELQEGSDGTQQDHP